jgi:Arc/MetJ family transcription regulator
MSDGHSVLYASYDGRPFLFVLGGATLEPKDFAALAPTIKSVGAPVVVAVARREVDTDAAVAAGAASCLALRGAEEFTTTLLDYLTKSRQEAITQVMAEFDGLFKLNVAAMSLARLSSAES